MKYIILILLLFSFNNCNTTNKINAEEKSAQKIFEPEGTYLVTHLYGEDVSEHKLTIKFNKANGKISGFSGCNSYSCNYEITQEKISFGIPIGTKIYCQQTANLEKKFLRALSETVKKKTENNKSLVLSNNTKEIILAVKEN